MRARFCASAKPSSCFGARGQRMRIDTPRTIAETGATQARVLWRKGSRLKSMCADRSDVLQGPGDAIAGGRAGVEIVDGVATVLERHAIAGTGAADEVALLEECPLLGVEVELDVSAQAVMEDG